LSEIRKRVVACEDALLSGGFLAYEILPIPDNAPPDIPRVTISTKHGHSMLQISLTGATFQTAYDNNFNTNWSSCYKYLERRVEQVYDAIKHISPEQISTQGFVAQIIMDNLCDDPIALLRNKISIVDYKSTLWDLGGYATIVKQDKYYVTLQLANARMIAASYPTVMASAHSDYHNCLIINVEVNDRKLSNDNYRYDSKKETANELLILLSDIITSQLNDFPIKGVFSL
jgi:hypothetical protein